jgi:hypothetical protein
MTLDQETSAAILAFGTLSDGVEQLQRAIGRQIIINAALLAYFEAHGRHSTENLGNLRRALAINLMEKSK